MVSTIPGAVQPERSEESSSSSCASPPPRATPSLDVNRYCDLARWAVANVVSMNAPSDALMKPAVRPGPTKLRLRSLTWLNRALASFGLRVAVSRARPAISPALNLSPSSLDEMPTALEGALYGLLSNTARLNIVQIGANDGVSGDPIHRFVRNAWNQTNLLLCEPQPELVTLLENTYDGHPSLQIFSGAITPGGKEFEFYRVRPALWPKMHAGYLIESPTHAAPSGIASVNYQHVADFVQRWSTLTPESAIEKVQPEALSVSGVIDRHLGAQPVHFLQIDVEGLDVALVSETIAAGLRPNVIHFEHSHADEASLVALRLQLEDCPYRVFTGESDTLAVLREPA